MSEPLDRLIKQMAKLTQALVAQTESLNRLAASNIALADAVLAPEDEGEESEEGQGYDLAGNRIETH